MADRLLTVSEVAAMLDMPTTTIRWHCREAKGLLRGQAARSGSTYLIPEHALKGFTEAVAASRKARGRA